MSEQVDRRKFLGLAGAVAALSATGAAAQAAGGGKTVRILGVSCSPRKGMTTSKAVQAVLDAAKAVDARVEVELIDLGGLKVAGHAKPPPEDDFTPLLAKLQDPAVGAIVIGSPSYYRGPSSLCRAFIERCSPLRDPKMLLAGKLLGCVAVGGTRNGGHELVIASIQAAMLCFGMIPVGGLSPATPGATLLSEKDDISKDEAGLETARKLGARLAELALR